MRISDWSSDVCSSDLVPACRAARKAPIFFSTATRPTYSCTGRGRPVSAGWGARSGRKSAWSTPRSHIIVWPSPCAANSRCSDRVATMICRAGRWNQRMKRQRSEEHTSELQSLMRISYAVFCLKTQKTQKKERHEYEPQVENKKNY